MLTLPFGILVICDEAHVGIPEDGTYVKDLDEALPDTTAKDLCDPKMELRS